MAGQLDSLESLSRALGKRLRQADESVLTLILARFENYVRSRLRKRFGALLQQEDQDDVISRAIYRVWQYRERYDPEKASLAYWFYLIARSSALEVLREKAFPAAQGGSLAEQPQPLRIEPHESPALLELEARLRELPEQDQVILLTFARYSGAGSWATDLAAEWQMPAATIRSRKRRILANLRQQMRHQRAGKTIMANVSADNNWEEIIQRLGDFFAHNAQTGDELLGLEERWNEAIDESADKATQEHRLKILQNAWRWAKGRAEGKEEALATLNKFIEQHLNSPVHEARKDDGLRAAIAQHPRRDLLHRVQRSLSGIGAAIERNMTTETRRAGRGEVKLTWDDNDAVICWLDNTASVIYLRSAAERAFAVHGEVPSNEACWLVDQFVDEVANRHHLCIPCFSYPEHLRAGVRPTTLQWARGDARVVPEYRLPSHMKARERFEVHVPAEFELDLARRDEKLAAVLDRALCAVATAKKQSRGGSVAGKRMDEETRSRFAHLVNLVAARTGRDAAEIIDVFHQALLFGQEHVKSAEDCTSRTQALMFLLESLNEPE